MNVINIDISFYYIYNTIYHKHYIMFLFLATRRVPVADGSRSGTSPRTTTLIGTGLEGFVYKFSLFLKILLTNVTSFKNSSV